MNCFLHRFCTTAVACAWGSASRFVLRSVLRSVLPMLVAVVFMSAAATGAAHASIVKCIDAAGGVTYQNSTCAGGAKGLPVDATPNSVGRFATEREIRDARRAAATAAVAE